MASTRGKLRSFRPSIDGIALEERVVMNGAGTSATQAMVNRRQLYQAYRAQFRAAANDLRQYLQTQIATAYASGTPDAMARTTLQTQINGAVNATAFRLSSQLGLLPEANDRLVARLQSSLLGNGRNSLSGRLNSLVSSGRASQSASALTAAVNRAITQSTGTNAARAGNFIATSPIYARSIDRTSGARIPVQTYMAQQVVNQFANTLGSLGAGFESVANAALMSNGVISTDPAVQQTFANQLNAAVSIATNQLGNNLAVFPNVPGLFPSVTNSTGSNNGFTNPLTGVNDIFYGTTSGGSPTARISFGQALSAVPTTTEGFLSGVSTAFNDAYQQTASGLGTYFGLATPAGGFSLPTSNFSSVFAPTFAGIGNGFNGQGSGAVGFGSYSNPTGTTTGPGLRVTYDSDPFGSGFYGLTTAQNTAFGFSPSGFSGFGLTTGTGTGTTTTTTTTTGGGSTTGI